MLKTHHSRQYALIHGTEDIEDISGEPHNDEDHAQAFSGGAPKIFDDLRRENHDPTSNRNRTGYATDSRDVETLLRYTSHIRG